MKQVFFDGKGKLLVEDVPAPPPPDNGALVRVYASLISAGTEMTQASGGGSLLGKALAQPELIGRAAQLALREGVRFTARAVQDVSESWFPAGYSSTGVVVAPGVDSGGMQVGMRVACAGAGFANHADFNAVPLNLLATLPANVSYRQAAFTTVGAIALQGMRRAEITLGETVVVVGLGLIGQITAQILDAAGCVVIGSDLIPERRALAARLAGAMTIDPARGDAPAQVMNLTGGVGADKVILCAATDSSTPTNEAFRMCRERGRVVMVGAMGMELERPDFYNKELDFVISRSAGPGRYDRDHEERGVAYPIGYVRWTEARNMAAFLKLAADGKLDLEPLISAEYPVEEAAKAYDAVAQGALGVLLTYGSPENEAALKPDATLIRAATRPRSGQIGLVLVGAGTFARAVHLPNIRALPAFDLRGIVSGGASAARMGAKDGIGLITTDLDHALASPDVDALLISTRHHLHASQTLSAIKAGKHVFVEKPMAMTVEEGEAILQAAVEAGVIVTVGFNRRLAPTTLALSAALEKISAPKTVIFRVNAGRIPAAHWLNDPLEGGGRLLGEGVHFLDFICGLLNMTPLILSAQGSGDAQNFVINMRFPDDSLGVIVYTAEGDPAYPKERVEIFAAGGVALLDDFKSLQLHNLPGKSQKGKQDKGHRALLEEFAQAVQGKASLRVRAEDGLRATRLALLAAESIRSGQTLLTGEG